MGSPRLAVLDTHALVWLSEGNPKLGKKARRLADTALRDDALTVSAISFWEIAMLRQRGFLEVVPSVDVWRGRLLEKGLRELPVTGEIGVAAAELEDFHSDPADRIITVTAIRHRAVLITADRRMLNWGGPGDRADARR